MRFYTLSICSPEHDNIVTDLTFDIDVLKDLVTSLFDHQARKKDVFNTVEAAEIRDLIAISYEPDASNMQAAMWRECSKAFGTKFWDGVIWRIQTHDL